MSTGADGGGADGAAGVDGSNPGNLLGVMQSGFFGNSAGGGYGKGGSGSNFSGAGANGSPGAPGGNSGYGAGGGGGGGAAGGAVGEYGQSGPGGTGGSGGNAGSLGLGGSEGGTGTSGAKGQSGGGSLGNAGGSGGAGSASGAGAALGGAIFVMDNAALLIGGLSAGAISSGEVKGGASAVGGADGAAAGTGIFLQGSGDLNFNPDQTYTVSDPITDETGAVANGSVVVSSQGTGPDGLQMGGGEGEWNLQMSGNGTLSLQGEHAFYGQITLTLGTLDLSDYQNQGANNLEFNGGILKQQPTSAMTLTLGVIDINSSAALSVNGYSDIKASSIQLGSNPSVTLTIDFDQTGFSGTSKVVLTTNELIPSSLQVISTSKKYKFTVEDNTITVSKK